MPPRSLIIAVIPAPPVSKIGSKDANINAADLGLYNVYDVGIRAYCYTGQDIALSCSRQGGSSVDHG
ncbi:hypothetical protein QBC42DRAFT_281862 [Cladorrhinum samala]|uniref:Uncharacterized protein n=1 Tax=Cladorrhinum samala TaxID=585594 RepID=A0AAV9I4I0_9PEZI|nr:hypothetical protein QBC42DRAFT_281862 [Cladorrhinum samala]